MYHHHYRVEIPLKFSLIFILVGLLSQIAYADCTGCCSGHGGVVCSGGITKCGDGTSLSATCVAKGCSVCTTTPAKPTVTTSAATSVTLNSATLNGLVNPNGDGTNYYFDHGVNIFYGAKTPTTYVGSGTSSVSASATISGLAEKATYHYRLVAANSGGTSYGTDVAFTCSESTPTNPSGIGSANPMSVNSGGSILLIVIVTPGSNPTSTGLSVTGNTGSIGGSSSQKFFDDGSNGDEASGDNKFCYRATIPADQQRGPISISISIADAQARGSTTSIQFTVTTTAAISESLIIFPHIADGGGYKTVFLLTNGSDTGTTATIDFMSSSGNPLTVTIDTTTSSRFSVPVQSRGSAKLTTSGAATDVLVGWAQVTTSPSVPLNGNAIFQMFNGSNLYSEASVPAVSPGGAADFYADEEGGFHTGFAVANPGPATATGTLSLRDTMGVLFGNYPLSIGPSQHMATFLSQIFSGAPSGRAEIELDSGSLSVTALRFHSSSVFSTVSVGQGGASGTPVSALFSPDGGVRNRIVAEIAKAKNTIDIAIYSFTADEIRDALLAARGRGVAIRIIADSSQAGGQGSEIATLESMGFNLKRMSGVSGGIMHNKYMIIDGRLLLTGSYNWSANAEDNNWENAVFIQGLSVIQSFATDFKKMWTR